jgi:hypothetical protein
MAWVGMANFKQGPHVRIDRTRESAFCCNLGQESHILITEVFTQKVHDGICLGIGVQRVSSYHGIYLIPLWRGNHNFGVRAMSHRAWLNCCFGPGSIIKGDFTSVLKELTVVKHCSN